MSPIVKQKGERFTLPSKYLLFILTALCLVLMLVTYRTNYVSSLLGTIAGSVVLPFDKGISKAGSYLSTRSKQLKQINDLLKENEELQQQIDDLTIENTLLQQNRYELVKLRELYDLSSEYDEFESVGARVIAKDSGNWFSSFVIDKGTDDGIENDMNVIAGGGLVGRIIDVGPNWAKVKSIIADDSNVSAMSLISSDMMIVSGSLEDYANGIIPFAQLIDADDSVSVGDKIVTSTISDKYLSGILIGYVDSVTLDANNLTKSGMISPAVDFEHLSVVLVVKQQKQVVETDGEEEDDL